MALEKQGARGGADGLRPRATWGKPAITAGVIQLSLYRQPAVVVVSLSTDDDIRLPSLSTSPAPLTEIPNSSPAEWPLRKQR